MTLQGAILLWLMAQTPSVDDIEGPPERLDRIGVIAAAIAVEAGGTLVVDREGVVGAADEAGLFVLGVAVPK